MRKRYWLGLGISAVLVAILVLRVDVASAIRSFANADFRYLVPALLLYFAGIVPRALRWAILLHPVRPIGVWRLYRVLVVGFMANDILPLRAGEAVRAFLLWNRERVEPGATVATILVERIFDGLALTGFLVAGSLLVEIDESLIWLTRVAAVVFAVGVAGVLALAIAPSFTLRVGEILLRPLPEKASLLALRVLRSFEDGLRVLRSWKEMLAVFVLSVAAWGLEAGMYYALMHSFEFQPRYAAAVLGTAVANLASMVPSSPGYVGTFDWGLLKVLSDTFGVDASQAAAYTGLVHAALIVPVVALGIFFVWREGLSLRRIASRESYARAIRGEPAERGKVTSPRSLP